MRRRQVGAKANAAEKIMRAVRREVRQTGAGRAIALAGPSGLTGGGQVGTVSEAGLLTFAEGFDLGNFDEDIFT